MSWVSEFRVLLREHENSQTTTRSEPIILQNCYSFVRSLVHTEICIPFQLRESGSVFVRPQKGAPWRSQGLQTRSRHWQPVLWWGLAVSPITLLASCHFVSVPPGVRECASVYVDMYLRAWASRHLKQSTGLYSCACVAAAPLASIQIQ